MTPATIPAAAWRKSTYSNADGNCVEVAIRPTAIVVRDSKDRTRPALTFAAAEWRNFLDRVQNGQLDLGSASATVAASIRNTL